MSSSISTLKTIINNRYLIGVWVWKDLRGRYIGSAGGWLWAALFPLAIMGTYFFIFSFFLKVRVPYAPGAAGYFMFLMSALLPWGVTMEALSRSTMIFFEQAPLVQKVAFPLEVLPVYISLAALLQPLIGLAIFGVLVAIIKGLSFGCVLVIPFILFVQLIFTMGLAFSLSVVSVFLRDFVQAVPVILQIWFFASPILYPESMVPDGLKWLLTINPLASLASIYHGLFLLNEIMVWQICIFSVWALALWWLGTAVFALLKDSVSDLV